MVGMIGRQPLRAGGGRGATTGYDGWNLPVESMLNTMEYRDSWDDVLARVRRRAL
jgi:hypothetical protein